jgi:hypothetical protein
VRHARPGGLQGLCVALLGAALLLRALVPAGWMPAQAGGGPAITLCAPGSPDGDPRALAAANAVFQAALGDHGQSPDDSHDGLGAKPCTFAGLTPLAPPSVPDALAHPPAADAAATFPPSLRAAVGRGLPAPPPPATGPPLRA